MVDYEVKYPIGEFSPTTIANQDTVTSWIADIEQLPSDLRKTVESLSPSQLDTPYRPDGWTVRQVVHHIGDSHLNSFVRFKWALTEDRPTIKPYREELWAELGDYSSVPVPVALDFLDVLHKRWVSLLRGLTPQDLAREYIHPDSGSTTLSMTIGAYVWHGRHHLAHITSLAQRENWFSDSSGD